MSFSPFRTKILIAILALIGLAGTRAHSLERQPASAYHARRQALAAKLNGGAAILFAAEEPQLDFMPYRQDANFYYLTGWNEPGAALLILGPTEPDNSAAHGYREILFLPTRNLGLEKYTGAKMDAATPDVSTASGVSEVLPMTELPAVLNSLIATDRHMIYRLWTQPNVPQAKALIPWTAATLGTNEPPVPHDVTGLIEPLRAVKDEGEVTLLRKASDASIAAQRVLFRAVHAGVTERSIAGKMTAAWMDAGCERPSYAPIVGSGINSTILHYAENSRTMQDGELLLVDAACEYSMYASDITRTLPVNGHFTARQREIYNVVLGAQQAAIDAFVASKSKINDRDRKDPDSLDNAAYNFINTHGKGLHGEPLGKYWLHGLGHLVGIDVHDPGEYPAVLKPGMVFTIEPGIYIPEEQIGVRIECVFWVGADGRLIDLTAALPHTAEDVEAAMQAVGRVESEPKEHR